ncbi:GrpB family protein [Glaciihabitans sp. dw_435]|uniref:GrpB family protein n=1 Tax=Glaciihabitans sp. dw_435 TaxID=2720081 RepID=UPI001BD510CE|nr:GrpB family protein [Glaciihabitans sp. dw_435]
MSKTAKPRRPDVEHVDLIGGTEKRQLEVVGYDNHWPAIFAEHRERLRQALGAADVLIEHIGSTSVPGLAAKPIVDIVVAVDDITAEEDYLPAMLTAGYVLRVREPGHRLVRTPHRDVHIHIYQRDDLAVTNYLLFRDRLRTDPDDRDLYARTKEALIEQGFDDMNAYSDAKTDVIAAILARAQRRS